ncbi:ABC transporter ATP-binding protein [Gemmobacter nanjingensis]|uniref:ABC transporter ATP-binding protein n=1 Tax=Gemmobacter nanjingensis TaxID=488454 RepID=A0ABQ3FP88_9RHOB|nr:ABC transporter ATP-binding protein [Gemmobacter nanjingensis]GHC31211.1 ABC transporter ATP-binding protein [Gemmobacter nanjingensis]
MSEPILALSGLTRRFSTGGGFLRPARSMTAVRGVDLQVARGDIVGVVGESGCGKSTLARLAMRLLEPSDGTIRFEGQDVTHLGGRALKSLRKKLQMVFQDPYSSLDPRYTVRDCIEEPFRALGELVPPGRIEDLLDQVGLPRSFAESYPHQMSGGQRQRVGIARALAYAPDFVVLDEPTASLDVSIQAQIIALLQDLHRQRDLTYLFISHDLGLVRYFCSRIVVMYLGSVVEVMEDPHAAPRHPYTRALMESSFVPDPEARATIVPLEGEIPSPFALPLGCPFAPRCPRVQDRCRSELPQPTATTIGRVSCFNPIEA